MCSRSQSGDCANNTATTKRLGLVVCGRKTLFLLEWNSTNNKNNNNATKKLGNVTNGKHLIHEYKQQEAAPVCNGTVMDDIKQRIRHAICQGDFGQAQGPLAPDGSRSLSQDKQAYWRPDYLTNTQSYGVNPQRVARVARLLRPTQDVPVDIRLGDLMRERQLQVYMTTRSWCNQNADAPLLAPETWQGYFGFSESFRHAQHYIWQTQMHLDEEDCAF